MALKDKLPVSYLLFTKRGRIDRLTYWSVSIFIWTTFYILFNIIEYVFSYAATIAIYPLLYWALVATAVKRLHDSGKRGYYLLLILIPILGPLVLIYFLGFKKGTAARNIYGEVPGAAPDYFKNGDSSAIPHLRSSERIINDITQLNPVIVSKVEVPESLEQLQNIIRDAGKPLSVGGGRFSMGGQTASAGSIHIDMRRLNHALEFSKENRTIKVEAGTRWCDIQHYIDEHGLSVKIMQTYANFTVGGSLNVNVHGRYIGSGPVILSVRSVDIILANGELVHASKNENADLFFASIGCYNAIAVIARVEFDLEENVAIKRVHRKMKLATYKNFFFENVREDKSVVFHNGDIYPPHYRNARAVSWIKTTEKPTVKTRLMPLSAAYPIERYFIGAFSRNKFGKCAESSS